MKYKVQFKLCSVVTTETRKVLLRIISPDCDSDIICVHTDRGYMDNSLDMEVCQKFNNSKIDALMENPFMNKFEEIDLQQIKINLSDNDTNYYECGCEYDTYSHKYKIANKKYYFSREGYDKIVEHWCNN